MSRHGWVTLKAESVQREYICLCQIASKRLEHHPELISLKCSWGLLSNSVSWITDSPLMLVFSLLFSARIEDSSSCREDTVQLLQVAEKHQPQEWPQPCPSRCGCSYHQVPQSCCAKEGTQLRKANGWNLTICTPSWDSHYPFLFLVICHTTAVVCEPLAGSYHGEGMLASLLIRQNSLINYICWQTSLFFYNNKDFCL